MKHQSFEEDSCDNIGTIGSVVGTVFRRYASNRNNKINNWK